MFGVPRTLFAANVHFFNVRSTSIMKNDPCSVYCVHRLRKKIRLRCARYVVHGKTSVYEVPRTSFTEDNPFSMYAVPYLWKMTRLWCAAYINHEKRPVFDVRGLSPVKNDLSSPYDVHHLDRPSGKLQPEVRYDTLTLDVDPMRIFYSYSHQDEALRAALDTHLALLRRDGLIEPWHDRQISAGKEWAGEIDEHLKAADIILLLISSDFIASDYCFDIEMDLALDRHDRGEARVVPIILRPCDWQTARFAKLQALPKDAKPVVEWPNQDRAFLDVAHELRRLVTEGKPASESAETDLGQPSYPDPQTQSLSEAL
ncbi:MAG: toll/interleukin-1 receptor domain-containing protein, partial [Acidobacteriota bacterium]